MLKVEGVVRESREGTGTFVRQVMIVFDGRIQFTYEPDWSRFNKGGFIEVGRSDILNERLYSRDQLWVPDVWYQRLMAMVGAIFAENKRTPKGGKWIKRANRGG